MISPQTPCSLKSDSGRSALPSLFALGPEQRPIAQTRCPALPERVSTVHQRRLLCPSGRTSVRASPTLCRAGLLRPATGCPFPRHSTAPRTDPAQPNRPVADTPWNHGLDHPGARECVPADELAAKFESCRNSVPFLPSHLKNG